MSVAIFTLCCARATAADELSDLKAQMKVLSDKIEAIDQKQRQQEQTPQTAASPPTQVINPVTGASVLPAWGLSTLAWVGADLLPRRPPSRLTPVRALKCLCGFDALLFGGNPAREVHFRSK